MTFFGAPGWNRTNGLRVTSALLYRLSYWCETQATNNIKNGATGGDRTLDLILTKDVLYRLSYCSVFSLCYTEPMTSPHPTLWTDLITLMGTTRDDREAGYIGPNGSWSNHSGSHMGGRRGQRGIDHREFPEAVIDALPADSPTDRMMQFMREAGAIRVDAKAGVASMVGMPTPRALAALVVLMNQAGHTTLTLSYYNAQLDLVASDEGILGRPDHIVRWARAAETAASPTARPKACRVS